jgi:hypothetical protein
MEEGGGRRKLHNFLLANAARPPALESVHAISLVSHSQFAFSKCCLKNSLRRSEWKGICLKQICEEVDGRRWWREECLLMDDGFLNGIC